MLQDGQIFSLRTLIAAMRKVPQKLLWFALAGLALAGLLAVDLSADLSTLKWWSDSFAVTSNLLMGIIISFVFYYFIVYIPERRRLAIIRDSTIKMYLEIKSDILYSVICASIKGGRTDLDSGTDFINDLMSPDNFRRYFEGGREADEGFYAFENQMGDRTAEFEDIVLNFELLAKQLSYLLQNYEFRDTKIVTILKRIEMLLIRFRHSQAGYDESKPLCKFLFEIFAGWSSIDGYVGYDYIEKILREL